MLYLISVRFTQYHDVKGLSSDEWEVSVAFFGPPVQLHNVVPDDEAAIEVGTQMECNIISWICVWTTLQIKSKSMNQNK